MSEGQVACYDCGLPYAGDHWVEAVVSHDTWKQISPTGDEGGILCVSCMAARLAQRGLSNVPMKLTAGPFVLEPRIEAALCSKRTNA